MENFKYLGIINGVLNENAEGDKFNIYSHFEVLYSERCGELKIVEYSTLVNYENDCKIHQSKDEHFLSMPLLAKNMAANFNEMRVKELIIAAYCDIINLPKTFDKIW